MPKCEKQHKMKRLCKNCSVFHETPRKGDDVLPEPVSYNREMGACFWCLNKAFEYYKWKLERMPAKKQETRPFPLWPNYKADRKVRKLALYHQKICWKKVKRLNLKVLI